MVLEMFWVVGLYTEIELSPRLATYTFPPLGSSTIGPGFTPTHTVLVATRLVVLIGLSEPVEGQTEFAPEFTAEMAALLHPGQGMKTREIQGGTGPQTVAAALKDAAVRLSAWRA